MGSASCHGAFPRTSGARRLRGAVSAAQEWADAELEGLFTELAEFDPPLSEMHAALFMRAAYAYGYQQSLTAPEEPSLPRAREYEAELALRVPVS